jgi:PTH1 family peptidyl-tRNA hydrolase
MALSWIIMGLGNPGPQYEHTRHNIGFQVVHRLSERHGITGKGDAKFQAIVGQGQIAGQGVLLVQPTTFMNLSGQSVQALTRFYKLPLSQVLVVYDDVALPFGRLRIRKDGSAGTHNGMRSILQSMGGDQNFPRLRLGVGEPDANWDLRDYVLAKFTPDEQADLPKLLDAAADAVTWLVSQGLDRAMSRYNPWMLYPPPPPEKSSESATPSAPPEVL